MLTFTFSDPFVKLIVPEIPKELVVKPLFFAEIALLELVCEVYHHILRLFRSEIDFSTVCNYIEAVTSLKVFNVNFDEVDKL